MVGMRIGMMVVTMVMGMPVLMVVMVVIVAMVMMMVPMVVFMPVVMPVVMVVMMAVIRNRLKRSGIGMAVHRGPFQAMFPAEILVAACPVAIAIARAVGGCPAHPFNMMVMACLCEPDFRLETQHLLAIFAHLAVHHCRAFKDFRDPVFQRRQHQRMIVEIAGLDEFDIGMHCSDIVGGGINPLHQHAGKQEIREYYNSLVAKPCSMFETRLDQRERDT